MTYWVQTRGWSSIKATLETKPGSRCASLCNKSKQSANRRMDTLYIVSNVEEEITGFFASADLPTCKDVVSIISLLAVVVIIRTKLLTQMQT